MKPNQKLSWIQGFYVVQFLAYFRHLIKLVLKSQF